MLPVHSCKTEAKISPERFEYREAFLMLFSARAFLLRILDLFRFIYNKNGRRKG